MSFYGFPDPYTLFEIRGEAEGEIPDYGWFNEWLYDSDVTPAPTITVTSAGDTYDGASGSFNLSVQGGLPSDYDWSYTAPAGAGNNPNVTFNGSSANVSSNAHWFAYPDGECSASFSSTYQIHGQALIAYQWYGDTTPFTIYVPNPGGETHSPFVSGSAMLAKGSDNIWRVVQNNYFKTQPVVVINVLPNSQFRTKVDAHESVHSYQFTSGMFGAYWDPAVAYARVSGFTDTTYAALDARVVAEIQRFNQEQKVAVDPQMPLAEAQAFGLSNQIPPLYLFQSSCGGI